MLHSISFNIQSKQLMREERDVCVPLLKTQANSPISETFSSQGNWAEQPVDDTSGILFTRWTQLLWRKPVSLPKPEAILKLPEREPLNLPSSENLLLRETPNTALHGI
jgi:hypothetical protein